jgi:hypothetical protein
VLDTDLLHSPSEDLLTMSGRVLLTLVGGKVAYQKPGFTFP